MATVSIVSRLDRSISLHCHDVIKDDGAGRSFQGRRLDTPIIISPGVNPGVDKGFFTRWQQENKGSLLHALFTVTDEDDPETTKGTAGAKETTMDHSDYDAIMLWPPGGPVEHGGEFDHRDEGIAAQIENASEDERAADEAKAKADEEAAKFKPL